MRLHETFVAGWPSVACRENKKFSREIQIQIKMAGLKIVPLLASVTAQIGAFTALLLQLHGLILLWKIHEEQNKNTMFMALQNRRNYLLRKLKLLRQRRLRRRKRSCWFKPGRSDQWWIKMINGEAPDEFWMKNFRMTKETFLALETELKPYISPSL